MNWLKKSLQLFAGSAAGPVERRQIGGNGYRYLTAGIDLPNVTEEESLSISSFYACVNLGMLTELPSPSYP